MIEALSDFRVLGEHAFILSQSALGRQFDPALAAFSDGRFIAVWNDDDADDLGISARLFDRDSGAIGVDFRVNSEQANVQAEPDVAVLTNGRFVVTWTDENSPSGTLDVVGQVFSSSGSREGGRFVVNTRTVGVQSQAQVTSLPDGGFAVAWVSNFDQEVQGSNVRVQRFSSEAAKTGGEIVISRSTFNANLGDLIATATGHIVVVYDAFVSGEDRFEQVPLFVSYDGSGTLIASGRLNDDGVPQGRLPTAAPLLDGGFATSWSQDDEFAGISGSSFGTWFQRFDSAGIKIGSASRLSTDASFPELSTLENGSLVLAARVNVVSEAGTRTGKVILRPIDETGRPATDPFSVESADSADQLLQDVVALPGGAFAVAWFERGSSPTVEDVRARVFRFIDQGRDVADAFRGSADVDAVAGRNGDDILVGGGGRDALFGNGGGDRLSGEDGDDFLQGNDGADILSGGSAADTLDGGLGSDRLFGGPGDDSYIVDDRRDRVFEGASEGVDTIASSASYKLGPNVESLRLIGLAPVDGTGNDLPNVLVGNSAANKLDGAKGPDRLEGGLGDDGYVVDDVGDEIVEAQFAGIDTIVSSIDYVLGATVEHLSLTGAALRGTGNDGANRITGGRASEFLFGLGGGDTLSGGLGNDTIDGGEGDDLIVGGVGRDVLTGGGGIDAFRFVTGDLGDTPNRADVIADFRVGGRDRIDFSRFDAVSGTEAVDAFRLIGSRAFSGSAGELRVAAFGGDTLVQGDTNGDGVADVMLRLTGAYALTKADFIGVENAAPAGMPVGDFARIGMHEAFWAPLPLA